jgi:hypothetical protein
MSCRQASRLGKELVKLVVGRGTRGKGGSGKSTVAFVSTFKLLPNQWLMKQKPGVSMLHDFLNELGIQR